MLDSFNPIYTDQFVRISKRWDSLLKIGESVCVIFPYLSDRQIRIRQYIDSMKDKKLIPVIINLSLQPVDEIEELKNFINQQLPDSLRKNTLKESLINCDEVIVLIISDGEVLLKVENEQFLEMLQSIILGQKNIRVLTAFETNILKSVADFNRYNYVFQNILYYPLYDNKDIMAFIDYLCQKWQMRMPQPTRKSIAYNSGGYFWLVKEACRIYRDNGHWSTEEPSFQLRLNSIVKSLSNEEKNIINACPRLGSYEKSEELKHLQKIGVIKEDRTISVPGLVKQIQEKKIETKAFELDNEEIILKGVSLSGILSATEYSLLKFFIQKPNMVVTRDEIASVLWPRDTENSYSQWAIDQAIKRLRDRLVSFRLPPTIIKSIRGVGYEFRT